MPSSHQHHSAGRVTIWKIGGSVFALADWAERVDHAIGESAELPLLIVGGGEVADVVRGWDDTQGLSDDAAHELAVHAMTFNARFVCARLPNSTLVESTTQAAAVWDEGRWPVLDAAVFLRNSEAEYGALPRSWDLTSDSIAAWVATLWPARKLVLVKSTAYRPDAVDKSFAELSRGVPEVRWLNLRETPPRCPVPLR